MPHYAAFHLGLHCLSKYSFRTHQDTKGPGPVAQLVTSLTADPGVASSIPTRSHTFMEIDHEITSTVILLLPLIQEGLLSVTSESMCTRYSLTA